MKNTYSDELKELQRIYEGTLARLEEDVSDGLHGLAENMRVFLSVYDKLHTFKIKHDVLLCKMEDEEMEGEEDECPCDGACC